MRMQRPYLLNRSACSFVAAGNKEKGLEAFRAALEQAKLSQLIRSSRA